MFKILSFFFVVPEPLIYRIPPLLGQLHFLFCIQRVRQRDRNKTLNTTLSFVLLSTVLPYGARTWTLVLPHMVRHVFNCMSYLMLSSKIHHIYCSTLKFYKNDFLNWTGLQDFSTWVILSGEWQGSPESCHLLWGEAFLTEGPFTVKHQYSSKMVTSSYSAFGGKLVPGVY